MRRYLLDLGVKSDKVPVSQELWPGTVVRVNDVKVEPSRIAA